MKPAARPLLWEPKGSQQIVACIQARQQGRTRSLAADYVEIGDEEARLTDKAWGFDKLEVVG
jgi:hypothetical protein